MPTLFDPSFAKTILLICEHSAENGAMGIVLNQPTSLNVYELLESDEATLRDESLSSKLSSLHIYAGGPVDTGRGFILHDCETEHESTIQIATKLFLTSSNDLLEKIAHGEGPENKLIVLGYAGWLPGQLEAEISANSWLTTEYQHELVFATPANQQWLAAGKATWDKSQLIKQSTRPCLSSTAKIMCI